MSRDLGVLFDVEFEYFSHCNLSLNKVHFIYLNLLVLLKQVM